MGNYEYHGQNITTTGYIFPDIERDTTRESVKNMLQ